MARLELPHTGIHIPALATVGVGDVVAGERGGAAQLECMGTERDIQRLTRQEIGALERAVEAGIAAERPAAIDQCRRGQRGRGVIARGRVQGKAQLLRDAAAEHRAQRCRRRDIGAFERRADRRRRPRSQLRIGGVDRGEVGPQRQGVRRRDLPVEVGEAAELGAGGNPRPQIGGEIDVEGIARHRIEGRCEGIRDPGRSARRRELAVLDPQRVTRGIRYQWAGHDKPAPSRRKRRGAGVEILGIR